MDLVDYIGVIIIGLGVLGLIRRLMNVKRLSAKKEQLKGLYAFDAIFLCNGIDDLGDSLIQIYGEPYRVTVRPGMSIFMPGGKKYKIKEVYRGDTQSQKSDIEISEGKSNSAIVIEARDFEWGSLQQDLKREGIIVFNIST